MSLYRRLGREVEAPATPRQAEERRLLKSVIQGRLAEELAPEDLGHSQVDGKRDEIREKIRAILSEEGAMGPLERESVLEEMTADIVGYGLIQPLLDDPEVSEIMVNSPTEVYAERRGRLEKTAVRFRDEGEIRQLMDRIVSPLGRRIDEASPMVDARLRDGSRMNGIIPPLALKGPCLTIRKFPRHALGITDLIRLGTLDERMAELLRLAVASRQNIIVSGGTGSGKTSTLNVLSAFIPADERIITIEDAAELRLQQDHVVRLETRPANLEGRGEVSIRQLVRNALRMRPDRIVVGEVRSGEALDMLQAMNTGHDGSLTTVHANGPRDVLSRLETMVLMAGLDLPVRAIRDQVASGIDLIVQQSRLKDGSRRITHITEVQGMEGETVILEDLFRFQSAVRGGEFRPTGLRPRFAEELEGFGLTLPPEILS